MPNPSDDKPQNKFRQLGLFSIILGDLVGYTGVGIGFGYWAWTRWGAPWWVLLITSLLGLSLAFYRVYQISKKEL